MGWLGWPPESALAADVNAILIAMEGRLEYLRASLGLPAVEQKPERNSYGDFREFAKEHNARRAAKREREARDKARQEAAKAKVKARG